MTDRFKFRIWNGEQMVFPDYITRDGYGHWKEDSIPNSSNKLMQCTGLKDVEGNLIYEGDIVEHIILEVLPADQIKGAPAKIKYTVEIGNGAFGDIVNGFKFRSHEPYPFHSPLWIHDIHETKIVGNIYETIQE